MNDRSLSGTPAASSAVVANHGDDVSGAAALDRVGALNVFVRSAETRSFTEAGRQMGISASAVGKAISRLEKRLGVRLFHRSTRSVTLTPEGAQFLKRCLRIIEEIEAAETELALAHSTPRGRLRVSLPLVGMLLMPVLGAFMRTYPEIVLDLEFSDRLVDVIDEGFDVAMRTGEAGDSQLITRSLGSYIHIIVGSPAYLAGHGTPEKPEDLVGHACLQHRFPSTGKLRAWPLERNGETLNIELPTTAVVSNIEPLISMAEQGLGLACVPDFTVREQLKRGSLVRVLQDLPVPRAVFRALWPSGRHLSPRIRAFVDFMGAHLFPETNPGP
ncbi:LysR family transcriptional regulator [Paraburkholderia sp.]|uniref:LysR family transcriptional regulator n=1 Tax=Paraburkholderia sp. TaxID=1926495 RepID=UPI002F4141D6